jgi:hypothetical protein
MGKVENYFILLVMETKEFRIKELTLKEQKETLGGNPIVIFIAGAILGGMIYDVYKAASLGLINTQINHPEYYNGPVHSVR